VADINSNSAVNQSGKVWAWGANWSGQLGDSTTDQRTGPVQTIFPVQSRTSILKVIGHSFITPGEEATFLIDYENILAFTLENSVVLVDFPAEFEFISATKNGIYHNDRHQVFWRLGDLNIGDKGVLIIKVAVQWGLAAHDTTSLTVDIGAQNIDTSFDLNEYVDHEAIEFTTEKYYSPQEISSLLSTNTKLKQLYDHALMQGYRSDNKLIEYSLSDGSSLILMMMINPDPFGPVYITVSGSNGNIQVFDQNNMTMLDENGGYTEDLDGNTINTWGTWAESNSPEVYKCVGNCIFQNVRGWATYIRDVYKGNKRWACNLCRAAYQNNNWDAEQCALCAEQFAQIHKKKKLKYGDAISKCITQCKNNPHEWQCQEDESLIACDFRFTALQALGAHITSGWSKHTCTKGKWKLTGTETCIIPTICRQVEANKAECIEKCPESSSAQTDSHAVNSVSTMAEENICDTNLVNHNIMFVYAHDPNAKSVDAPGGVILGQTLTYTLEYENEGAVTAYGVYVMDELDSNLAVSSLTINDDGEYFEASRRLSWEIGELDAGEQGMVTFSVDIKDDVPSGTEIINLADVHFPSADEITPTNPVVNIVKSIVAEPQTISTVTGTPIAVTLSGKESSANPLTFSIREGPYYGSLSGSAPNITYTPMDEFSGQDTFTFIVNNGLIDSDPAVVRINVDPNPFDANPPVVLETDPPSDALNVLMNQDSVTQDPDLYGPVIRATFSEPLDVDTVTASAFTIEGLSGEVTYDRQTRTILFIPSSALAYGTTYTAHLNTSLTDLTGNKLTSTYTWQFTTQSQINIEATLPGNTSKIDFGTVELNAVSEELIISLLNTGPLDLVITSVTIAGTNATDFEVVEDNCSGSTITEFENETIRITFKPLSAGSKQASLSILSNDPDTPDLRIDLTGSASTDQNDDSGGGGGGGGGGCYIDAL